MRHWPTWLISPAEAWEMSRSNPYRAFFYLSVGGWFGAIVHLLTTTH